MGVKVVLEEEHGSCNWGSDACLISESRKGDQPPFTTVMYLTSPW